MAFHPFSCFWRARPFSRHLPGGDIDTVKDVYHRDRKNQRRERPFIVVAGGLVPDVIGNRIRSIAEPRHGLGERQGGAFGIGEIRGIAPGGHGEEAFVRLTCAPGDLRVHVEADTTTVDLAGTQVDEIERLFRHTALLDRLHKRHHRLHGFRHDHRGVAHPCVHDCSPAGPRGPCHIGPVQIRHCYDGTQRENVTMDQREWLTEQFEETRGHLRAVAYRMLGSLSEADDAVQDAWLKVSRSETTGIENPGGWLTTVVARVCLDMLRSRKSRREAPLDEQAPERVPSRRPGTDPEQEAILADSVGLALLVVLDTLTPAERLAFVLHDMFAVPFEEIAPIVGRCPAAARQLASRARRRVRQTPSAPRAPDLTPQRTTVDAFLAALRGGDFEGPLAVLEPDAVLPTGAATAT